MEIARSFEMQKVLDEHILDRFPNLRKENLLPKKILALQVELGELANCWRGFKFWSEDREPRTCECDECGGTGKIYLHNDYLKCKHCKNPLLEEYVDCLHFILSIGNDLRLNHIEPYSYNSPFTDTVEKVFIELLISTGHLLETESTNIVYTMLFCQFVGLSEKLGFSWEEVEEAYIEKNAINHKRQETGY